MKFDANNTFFVSLYEQNTVINLIFNVVSLRMNYEDNTLLLFTDKKPVEIVKDKIYEEVSVCYCDDATIHHADDWANLGFTRLLFQTFNTKISFVEEGLLLTFERVNENFIIPERHVYEISDEKFYL